MDAPITPTAPSIGLALSGGGVRATLFALGALIAIVDSGQNRRVSEITSVSGGSITNAFVAQRCDFSNVGPAEFDQIAGSLIRRVTTGLVPRRLVAALYGLSGLLIASVVALSWPLSLAWPFDLLLCFCYGLALLLRGIVLARLLGAKLFSDAALPHTLRQQQGQVNHVFCTTDLNSTLPVYLCTRKPFFFSPVWGSARSDQAGDLDFTTAVRASAAFPGGIPPRRLRLRKLDVRPGAQAWTARLGRLRFRDVSPDEVRALYLSDGGVWNNLGTDWYLPETRAQVVTSAAFGPESSALIVVDATPPPPATENLWYLRFPWLAELLTIARVLNVLYVSTVVTRIAELERKRQEASDSTGHDRVVRMVDPLRVARNAAVCWKGRDTWSGRRGWFGRTGSLTERLVHQLPVWNARVPTTLFRIPREIGFQLVLHGYLATWSAFEGRQETAVGAQLVKRLAGLCELDTDSPEGQVHELSRTARFTDPGTVTATHLVTMLQTAGNSFTDLELSLPDVIREAQDARRRFTDISYLSELSREARHARGEGDVSAAAQKYEEFLVASAAVEGGGHLRGTHVFLQYAACLAEIGDPRAEFVAQLVERRLAGDRDDAASWLLLAKVHADRTDGGGVVRCLREWQKRDPRAKAHTQLRHAAAFRSVLGSPEVQAFLGEREEPTRQATRRNG